MPSRLNERIEAIVAVNADTLLELVVHKVLGMSKGIPARVPVPVLRAVQTRVKRASPTPKQSHFAS